MEEVQESFPEEVTCYWKFSRSYPSGEEQTGLPQAGGLEVGYWGEGRAVIGLGRGGTSQSLGLRSLNFGSSSEAVS